MLPSSSKMSLRLNSPRYVKREAGDASSEKQTPIRTRINWRISNLNWPLSQDIDARYQLLEGAQSNRISMSIHTERISIKRKNKRKYQFTSITIARSFQLFFTIQQLWMAQKMIAEFGESRRWLMYWASWRNFKSRWTRNGKGELQPDFCYQLKVVSLCRRLRAKALKRWFIAFSYTNAPLWCFVGFRYVQAGCE